MFTRLFVCYCLFACLKEVGKKCRRRVEEERGGEEGEKVEAEGEDGEGERNRKTYFYMRIGLGAMAITCVIRSSTFLKVTTWKSPAPRCCLPPIAGSRISLAGNGTRLAAEVLS